MVVYKNIEFKYYYNNYKNNYNYKNFFLIQNNDSLQK